MMIKSLTILAFGLTMIAGQTVLAEEYKVYPGETGVATCQSGTKSDALTVEGEDEVKVAHAEEDGANAAICVSEGSASAIHVRWSAAGSWKSTGTIGHGCAEIRGASKVKVRAVNTNFQEIATYYTCVQP